MKERSEMKYAYSERFPPNDLKKFLSQHDIIPKENVTSLYFSKKYGDGASKEVIQKKTALNPYDVMFVGSAPFLDKYGINPYYYGDRLTHQIPYGNFNEEMDQSLYTYMYAANVANKKTIAFGRAALLGCIFSGSPLVQHVINHAKFKGGDVIKNHSHDIFFLDGTFAEVPSAHTSMMYPFISITDSDPHCQRFPNRREETYSILGYSISESSRTEKQERIDVYQSGYMMNEIYPPKEFAYFNDHNQNVYGNLSIEPEIVLFRETNMLCIQPNILTMIENSSKEGDEYYTSSRVIASIIKMFLEDKL